MCGREGGLCGREGGVCGWMGRVAGLVRWYSRNTEVTYGRFKGYVVATKIR